MGGEIMYACVYNLVPMLYSGKKQTNKQKKTSECDCVKTQTILMEE